MIKKTILLILVLVCLNGCTRDDICSETTQTTSLLIITFKDVENPQNDKEVSNLSITTDYLTSTTILETQSTDSIAIPLRPASDTVRYRFIKNTGTSSEMTDVYSFVYSRENIYVSRACSFKTVYSSLSFIDEEVSPPDWIKSIIVLNPTVADETQAHINIFH